MASNFKVLNAGTLRTITAAWVKQAGVLRRLKTAKVMDGGSLRTVGVFADPLSASMSPSSVSGEQMMGGSAPAIVTTNAATLVKAGGLDPVSYAWTHESGDTATINSPASASTTFTTGVSAAQGIKSGVFRCTVTDATGATASATVTATFTRVQL